MIASGSSIRRDSVLGCTGDVLQGAAADCNSAGETHAWFDSRVAHHFFPISDRLSKRKENMRGLPFGI